MKKEIQRKVLVGLVLLQLTIVNVLHMVSIEKAAMTDHQIQSETINANRGMSAEKVHHAYVKYTPVISNHRTEQGPENPNDALPLIDEGYDTTNAAGLAEYYGVDISSVRGILPGWIPTTDRTLFEAYLNLYKHTTLISYGPNGMNQTSGYDLGMYIANNKLSIAWADKRIVDCGANGLACVDRNNPDPGISSMIFMVDIGYTPVNIADIYAGRIAHEAFHLTFPYGNVNSKLEEMDACRIGSIIVGFNAPDDYRAPDYRPEAINNWVAGYCSNVFGTCSYETLSLYPSAAWKSLYMAQGEN